VYKRQSKGRNGLDTKNSEINGGNLKEKPVKPEDTKKENLQCLQ